MTDKSVGIGAHVEMEDDSTFVFCIFCRQEVQPDPDSTTDYSEHLLTEHKIQFEVDYILKKCIKKSENSIKGTKNSTSNHLNKENKDDSKSEENGENKFQNSAVQTDKLRLVNKAVQTVNTGPIPSETKVTAATKPLTARAPSTTSSLSIATASTRKIPWFAGCEYRCRVCGKLYFYNEDLREHIKRRHFSPNEYLEKYHTLETKATVIRCKICSMSIKRHYSSVWSHLNKDHGISLFDYQEKYGMGDYTVNIAASQNGFSADAIAASSEDEAENGDQAQKRLNPERSEAATPEAKRPRLAVEPLKLKISVPVTLSKESAPAPKSNSTSSSSKLWFIGCEYGCMIAGCKSMMYDMPDMMQHIKKDHDMTPRQYMDLYRKLESKFHWYSCGVCQSRVKHQKSTIIKHLETHDMNLVKYTEIFHPTELSAVSTEKRAAATATATATASAPASRVTYEAWSRGGCKFRCGVCKFTSECSAEFWKHASKEHLLNIAEYKTELGNPCVTYKEIQCLGCNKLLRYDPGTMANHASHAHDMSMEEFYRAFFKPQGSESPPKAQEIDTRNEDGKYDDEARHWADQCVYDCRICNVVSYINYGSLFDHIKSKHNISVEDYKAEYGEMASKKIMHHCRLCQGEFLHTSAIMRKHLKRVHETNITQYYLDNIKVDNEGSNVSDDGEANVPMDQDICTAYAKWKKGCEYECKVCNSIQFSWSNLNHHLKSAHDISADDYREKHGILMTKKSYHKCFICRAPIIQETKNLKLHMKKRHELCLDEYYVKYVNPKNGRRSIHVSHSQPVPALANSAPKVSTSISFGDWKYACRYDCKICNFTTRHSSDFSTHMSGKHGKTLAEYSKIYGKSMTYRVQHKCHICGNLIIQQPQSMKGHLTMHSIGLEEYYIKYVMDEDQTTGGNSVVQEDNTAVPRSSRNGSSRGGGGAAAFEEEPSNDADYYNLEESTYADDEELSLQALAEEYTSRLEEEPVVDDEDILGEDDDVDQIEEELPQSDETEISYDVWRHACVYSCKICQHSSRHHADIYSHMSAKHELSLRDYSEQYGKPMTKEVYHNCHICGKDLLQQSKNLKKHVKHHNLTLEKYFDIYVKGGKVSTVVKKQEFLRERLTSGIENSITKSPAPVGTRSLAPASHHPVLSDYARWKNACKFECKVCNYATKAYFTFNFHVKDKHGLVVQDYIKEYGKPMTKKIYHRCVICGAAFLQIAKTITRHLQLHAMTLQQYYDEYIVGEEGASLDPPALMNQTPRAPRLMTPPKKGPIRIPKDTRVSKCLSKSPYLTFCWNQCKETCGMCGQIFSTSATLHKHVRFVHNVELEWYKSHHVTSVDDISTHCLICSESVQLTQKSMETHLRSAHSISLMNYEEQFNEELSSQFEQLQNIRQSSGPTDEEINDPDNDDPLSMLEESSEYPNLAAMMKTEIRVEDRDFDPNEDTGDGDVDAQIQAEDDDEYLDDEAVEEIEEDDMILEPEQTMLEGSDEASE